MQLGGEALVVRLHRLFEACLRLSYHPRAFKDAILVMVRKPNKSPQEPKGWRPIALLSSMGKLLERIVALKMMEALKDQPQALPATQFGGETTTEALQYLLNIIYNAWSENPRLIVTVMCLDIGGAYDNVYRQKLLEMLVEWSMPPWIVEFVRSFLSHRKATYHLPGLVSKSLSLNTGIPQGSPLSPILFLLFAAPLLRGAKATTDSFVVDGQSVQVTTHAFAYVDDTYLVAVSDSFKANCTALQGMHGRVQTTAGPLDIVFGPEKYHVMHFQCPGHLRPSEESSEIPDIPGFNKKPEKTLKILGVEVDPSLTWEAHVAEIKRKVNQRLRRLSRISGTTWGPPLDAIRQTYLTWIRPVMTYGCGAWFVRQNPDGRQPSHGRKRLRWAIKQKLVEALQSVQYRCLVQISGAFAQTCGKVIEKELFIENLPTLLYAQAAAQRARLLWSRGKRWRHRAEAQPAPGNPFHALFEEAREFALQADDRLRVRRAMRSTRRALEEDAEKPDPWTVEAKRNELISNRCREWAGDECAKAWNAYRSAETTRERHRKLPAALSERWGRQSFRYYRGMGRAQSTMLLHCRTESIGLACRLHQLKVSSCP